MKAFLFFALAGFAFGQKQTAAELGQAMRSAGLDVSECYLVRDLEITQGEAQFYLTSGYLIFGKPVNGAPVVAVFSADTDGGDAEVLLLPPDRSERKSLAAATGAPNLDEHFSNAVFLFTDAGIHRLVGDAKKVPETGALMADRWNETAKNIISSFDSRMVLDLLDPHSGEKGFFEALIQGRKLGNFDVGYDPRMYEQLEVGQITSNNGKSNWQTWTSFTSRNRRGLPPLEPEERILGYRIEATLDSSLELHCITRIRIQATSASRNAIPFDFSGQMTASEAKVDGVPAEVYERESARNGLVRNNGNELLLVVPPQPLDPGSEHEIEIRHSGRVVLTAGNQVYFVSARGNWYPDRDAQFATYDATYRYPKNLDLVSAGRVTEDRIEGEERITRRVPEGRLRLLAFNLGQYERKTVQRNGFQVEICANREIEAALQPRPGIAEKSDDIIALDPLTRRTLTPPILPGFALPPAPAPAIHPADALSPIADEMAAAMGFYRARFGPPPENLIEVSPVPGNFGQGFAGMIYLSTLSYLPVTARPLSLMSRYERAFYGPIMRAHEAAHQWWGNVVTAGSYHHEWLMEALANYSALMFLETRKGPKFMDGVLDQYRRDMLAKNADGQVRESEGPVVQGRRLQNSADPNAWNAIVYGKGTWIIHMLRRRMGDQQFMKMLAELRRRYEWKTISTEEFRALCAEFLPLPSSDPKLEDFFDQWVYGTGVPALKLNYSVKGQPGAYKLTGTLTQTDVADDFSVLIPVEIQTGRGKPVVRQVRTGSDPVTFTVPVTMAAAKAVLDPGSTVLRR